MLLLLAGLALGRLQARPRPKATEIFEVGLSTPHLFRLGRADAAVAGYERLLVLVGDALRR